jgi:hypothetical protein
VGSRAGLDRCGKSHPHRDLIPKPSSPLSVAIPTELHGPRVCVCMYVYVYVYVCMYIQYIYNAVKWARSRFH